MRKVDVDVDVVVKQAQAYGLYARLFLLFNIITNKSNYYSYLGLGYFADLRTKQWVFCGPSCGRV